jgi:nitroimidazol reductase NimA-like FMN-containing flavoprotein (pyridoxamine 5'-phosphate oxidase superfamily)
MPGYGVGRSRQGLLAWRTAADRLARSHNYWLVTTQPDGRPHAMPIWGLWRADRFFFSSGRRSRKTRNLEAHPRCVVCTERADEAVIVEGEARPVTDPAVLASLARPYQRKYRPWTLDLDLGPVYALRPRVVFGVFERSFPRSATRWTFPGRPPGDRRARPRT